MSKHKEQSQAFAINTKGIKEGWMIMAIILDYIYLLKMKSSGLRYRKIFKS